MSCSDDIWGIVFCFECHILLKTGTGWRKDIQNEKKKDNTMSYETRVKKLEMFKPGEENTEGQGRVGHIQVFSNT